MWGLSRINCIPFQQDYFPQKTLHSNQILLHNNWSTYLILGPINMNMHAEHWPQWLSRVLCLRLHTFHWWMWRINGEKESVITNNDCIPYIYLPCSKSNKSTHLGITLTMVIKLGFMPRTCISLNNAKDSWGGEWFHSNWIMWRLLGMENLGINNNNFIPWPNILFRQSFEQLV